MPNNLASSLSIPASLPQRTINGVNFRLVAKAAKDKSTAGSIPATITRGLRCHADRSAFPLPLLSILASCHSYYLHRPQIFRQTLPGGTLVASHYETCLLISINGNLDLNRLEAVSIDAD